MIELCAFRFNSRHMIRSSTSWACSAIGIGLDVVLATTYKYVRSDRVFGIADGFYELRDTSTQSLGHVQMINSDAEFGVFKVNEAAASRCTYIYK